MARARPYRVALSNNRILAVENGQVTFSYRDRKDKDRLKSMTLDAEEFIRRFLLHILPDGFMRANQAPRSAPLCSLTICIALTEVQLRSLVQHVPSTRLRIDSLPSLLPGSCPNLITPTLWG